MEFLAKNGQVHAYVFSTGGLKLTAAGDNKEANETLNAVLEDLQNQGYQVVDVKMTTALGGAGQTNTRFMVLYQ